MAAAAVVAILTRAPGAGGKSRLFAALGCEPDPALLQALLLDTLDGARVPGVTRVVAVEPPQACDEVRAIVPDDVRVFAQAEGSLGDRMRLVMADALASGAPAVAVIGSDLPDVPARAIADSFVLLERDPGGLVLGPSTDGGYYLIAASHVPDVFDGIEWGTPHVLEQTRDAARRRHLSVHLVQSMNDVDTPSDLMRVRAPRTVAWVRTHRDRLPPC